jgi:hypothetical protein
MKICYDKIKTVDEILENLQDRLDFITSELECPTWMLGNVYRYKLATEARSILRRMSTCSMV